MTASGYQWCSCRDCFDVVVASALCTECEEAGCEVDNGECQRHDAYGAIDEEVSP